MSKDSEMEIQYIGTCALLARLSRKIEDESIFREGINIKSLNAVVLAAGGKSEIALLQTIGRALRRSPGKDEAVIVEFLDVGKFLSEHVCERLQVFNELGIL